jgi:hypothetical protein
LSAPATRIRLHLGLLAVVTALVYANALGGSFQFDDFNVIVDQPAVHTLGAWARGLPGIRPLLKATYLLNWSLGPGPLGFHLLNVGLHGLNAALAYLLLRRWLARAGAAEDGTALLAAMVFALHPAQTEAVTYICGRSSSLMACFYLGGLLAYARGREEGGGPWRQCLAPGLFLLAFLVKESAVTFPLALVLWEATGPRPSLRATWTSWALLAVLGGFLLGHAGYRHLLAYGFANRSLGSNLLSQIHGVAHLLALWCWPAGLNVDPWLPVARHWTLRLGGEALLLAGLLAAGVAALGRRRQAALGVLWFFLHLLATNALVPRLDVANDRQLYLAGLGLAFLAAGAWMGAARRWGFTPWLVLPVLLLMGGRTWLRNRDYRSELTLWASSVRVEPANPRAHNNLGWAWVLAGDEERARAAFQTALRLDPDYGPARVNLSNLPSAAP